MAQHLRIRLLVALLAALALVPAGRTQATDSQGTDSQGLVLTRDGAFVVDARSRLAWPRCVEGMQWSGTTCTGEPRLMSYGEASAWAAARAKADGVPWRLPRVPELRRWAGKNGKAEEPAAGLFPAAPMDWHWTMTVSIDTRSVNPYNYDNIRQGRTEGDRLGVQQGWAVNMATGEAQGDVPRRSRLVVRLVVNQ
jgi:hypothetical protein